MTKKLNAPAIRFKGFSDAWEQRKFSDITFPAGEKNRDNLPLESYSITNEHGFVPQDEKFENGGTMREADKRMYYIVSPNSFAYNPARINVGSIGYQNIGKNVIVSSLYEVFKTSEDVDDRLLWHWFKSPDFQKLIMQLQEGGVRLYFYYDKLCMGEVSLPSLEEQRKIGKLFDTLDNLITLHQRKCISFTGRAGRLISTVNKKRITSSWEQRKFSELVQIERGGSPRPIDDFITDAPNGLNWIKIGDAPTQGNYITKTAEKIRPEGLSKTREVHPGDLILSNSMSFGKPYIMGIDGCIHDGWLLIRNTYGVFDLTFLCHLLGTPQMLSQYRSLAAGSTVNNLNKELVGNTVVTIPSITEQRVLGDYLEQLDNLITLHQRQPFLHSTPEISLTVQLIHPFYTSSWEQRKAKDLCSISTGKSNTQDRVDDGIYPFYVRSPIVEHSNRYLFDEEAVLTVGDGVGTGKVFHYVNGKYDLHQRVYRMFDFSEEITAKYFYYYFSNHFYDRVMAMTAKTSVDSVRYEMIADMDIALPKVKEQMAISAYFDRLDNLITLHQRKFEKLTNVKKSMLEKMFPQNGSSYPEIRFKGFTDPWEQRKLGEIGSVSMCRRIFKEQTSETGDIPFYKIGTFGAEPDAFISRELFEEYKSKYPYPKKGDILISASGSIGRTVEFAGNNEYFQDSNIVWLSHDERLSNSFLKCFYSVVKWAGIEGSTIKRLYNDNILNTVICMPSVPEQEHIGLFFENLDNLITLHQRELEKLQNIKKSMLEKMFV